VKQALERADTIAAALGSESVGPEHFLLGLLQVEGTKAGDLLRREGLTADWVRREIIRRMFAK
jgi:ATP-dependent Clp protease ATP-binding subunit ClpA